MDARLPGRRFAAGIAAFVLGACGGGSGSTSGTAVPAVAAPPATTTAAPDPSRPAVFVGDCWLCGTVGVALALDGRPTAELGRDAFVVAQGVQPAPNIGPRWTSADARTALVGTVVAVDVEHGEVRVGAERVRGFGGWLADAGRLMADGSTVPLSIAELRAGDRVRVLGYPAADGATFALALRRATVTEPNRIVGSASDVDANGRRLAIGPTPVDYSRAQLEGLANGAIADGTPLDVVGRVSDGVLVADVVRRRTSPPMEAGTLLTAYGAIARIVRDAPNGTTEVEIAGQPLRFAKGCQAEVVPGDFAYATGVVRADGVIDATPGDGCYVAREGFGGGAGITAEIEAIDAGVLTVGGARIRLQPETSVYGETYSRLAPAALAVGDRVAISAWPGAVPGRGFAGTVERRGRGTPPGEPRIAAEGYLRAVGSDAIEFLARPVRVDRATAAGTRYCNLSDPLTPMDPAAFMRALVASGIARSIRMSLEVEPSGGWHALTVEMFDMPYCD